MRSLANGSQGSTLAIWPGSVFPESIQKLFFFFFPHQSDIVLMHLASKRRYFGSL